MTPQPDIIKPADPYSLLGSSWPKESESAYHAAGAAASDASTSASGQAQSATDAEGAMADEHGKTAQAVSGGYGTAASTLREHAITFTTFSAWMTDAAGKVGKAKSQMSDLVNMGTEEIRNALSSETQGTSVSPSSTELTNKYRADISQVKSKLDGDLAAIGHSLAGDLGASRTPSYVSVSLTPTPEQRNPADQIVAYNTGQSPEVEPQRLPEMPRASSVETPSAPSTSSTPAVPMNPTLAGLISPQSASSGAGSPSSNGAGTPGASSGAVHPAPEQRQQAKSPVLPGIPNIPLPDLPATAASIATVVTSATNGTQLPTTTPASTAPTSTGSTPGTSGTPMPPAPGLGPIGGLPTAPVQASPAPTGTPSAPAPGAQTPAQQVSTPAPRGPVVTADWLQRTYGTAPGLELPKAEITSIPTLFIADLPEPEAHLHRTLASIRQAFEEAGWCQPMAVAVLKRGLESRTVFVTSDAVSIHPAGVLMPTGVIPLGEMPNTPAVSELSGSLMVTDKLTALIPRGWTVEHLLSTVPGGENSQSIEQYQTLVEAGEVLPCTVSRGRDDVTQSEAVSAFALAVLGQATSGISNLDSNSSRLKAARWVGVQPTGYLDTLARWYLADAAESMSRGRWGEAVHAIEKFQSIRTTKSQAA